MQKYFFQTLLRVFQRFFQWTAKGAGGKGPRQKNVKNRQKVSKIYSTLFDIFRSGQKNVKKRQKTSKYFSTLFDNFRGGISRGTIFPAPLGGSDF